MKKMLALRKCWNVLCEETENHDEQMRDLLDAIQAMIANELSVLGKVDDLNFNRDAQTFTFKFDGEDIFL